MRKGTTSSAGGLPCGIDLVSVTQALLVTECLSFRRAANVLGIRQSAVSRRIQSLEDALGVSLFERYHGGVRITAAGALFFDRARSALSQLEHAARNAGAAGRGEHGCLRVGIVSSIATGFLRELLRTFCEQHRDVELEVSEVTSREYLAFIRKGRLDVTFVIGAPTMPNCQTAQFWAERVYVVLPEGHSLCARTDIEWKMLREERFILRQSDPGPTLHDHVIKRLGDLGYHPRVHRFHVGRETALHLVALRMGLSLTSEATIGNAYPGVQFRPIAGDNEVIPFSAVWSSNNDNPAFRRFLSLARVLAKTWNNRSGAVMMQSLSSLPASAVVGLVLVRFFAGAQILGLLP